MNLKGVDPNSQRAVQLDTTNNSLINYRQASDFSALDYPSMDFFNQGPSYTSNNRPGGGNGYGGSRW